MSLPRLIVGTRHCRVLYIIPVQPELIDREFPHAIAQKPVSEALEEDRAQLNT